MDKFGNDPRERDPKPVVRHLIPVRLDGKGLLVVTDWQGRERRFASVKDGLAYAASLYPIKRPMVAADSPDERNAARTGDLPNTILWHAQRGQSYSRGKASKVRHLVRNGVAFE